MPTEKTSAIILRVVEFSETSCVVTLFTETVGKIGALAKGARRPKSPFESAIDLLAVCRILFIHKSSDALDLLTEAKLERRFRAATRDLSRLYAGYYVAELLQDLTDYGDPHPALYRVADHTLAKLDGEASVAETVLRFEVMTLHLLGFLPNLETCVICGQPAAPVGRVLFGHEAAGVLCGTCRPGQQQVVSLSRGVLEALRQASEPETEGSLATLDRRLWGELRGLLHHYLTNLLGRPPRMHKYLAPLMAK
ncbi:MAG: DNA repair protein RecO [Planctomycetota bacterium]|nr:DNA repair protein RecO [Planctomycetota bacterium]